MLNQLIVVGRLVKDIEVHENENGKSFAEITLAVPRSFKNMDGIYDTDFINFRVFDNIAKNTSEYCHKGDIIGVKGRIQSYTKETDKSKETEMQLIAEKVTFLSSKSRDEIQKSDKEQSDR